MVITLSLIFLFYSKSVFFFSRHFIPNKYVCSDWPLSTHAARALDESYYSSSTRVLEYSRQLYSQLDSTWPIPRWPVLNEVRASVRPVGQRRPEMSDDRHGWPLPRSVNRLTSLTVLCGHVSSCQLVKCQTTGSSDQHPLKRCSLHRSYHSQTHDSSWQIAMSNERLQK